MLEIFLASLFVMFASLTGVVSVWKRMGKVIERNLSFLVSFSSGVFLIIAYQLIQETFEHAETPGNGLFWIIIGTALIWGVFRTLPAFHHHHDEKEGDHRHSNIDARRILASDAIHNIGDGILLAASFGASTSLGAVTALSIFIHELVQETSEFFVLRQAGYSTRRALSLNLLVSSTILIGAIGSTLLIDTFEIIELPILGIAAGSFLIVVFYDLIPHSIRTSKRKKRLTYLRHIIWFLAGLLLMIGINSLAPHGHEEEPGAAEEEILLID